MYIHTGYRVARWALVMGYHDLAASLLRLLVSKMQCTTSKRAWREVCVHVCVCVCVCGRVCVCLYIYVFI